MLVFALVPRKAAQRFKETVVAAPASPRVKDLSEVRQERVAAGGGEIVRQTITRKSFTCSRDMSACSTARPAGRDDASCQRASVLLRPAGIPLHDFSAFGPSRSFDRSLGIGTSGGGRAVLKSLVMGIGLLATGAVPAGAGHLQSDPLVQQWHDARYVCKLGKDRQGARVPEHERDAICHTLERFSFILREGAHCWSVSEQEWFPSGRDDRSCDRVATAR